MKTPCCTSSNHRQKHTHLRHIPNISNVWPHRNEYLNPTEMMSTIIARLEKEDRCLDLINGGSGSLANALAKELYGDENQFFAGYETNTTKIDNNVMFDSLEFKCTEHIFH